MIDKEMFEEWLAHPVTEHVLKRVGELAEKNKAQWIARSWDQGICDPKELIEMKALASAAKDLSELKYEDVSDDEPKRDLPDGIQGSGSADQG
jgi:hypothetical protein